MDVIAGDKVFFSVTKNQGIVEEILPRKTVLDRPTIANVSMLIIVTSLSSPEPSWGLLDRLLVLGAFAGLKIVLVFNKIDIAKKEIRERASQYEKLGYKFIYTSAVKGIGIEDLRGFLKDEIAVFAGSSGVGKSSLINALEPELFLDTAEVSAKLGSGRHTTRYVSLLPLSTGGLVADTPGFNRISMPSGLKKEELGYYFPEIQEFFGLCRFNDCLHKNEPDCRVIQAVETGIIDKRRYQSYLHLLEEIFNQERRY